MKAIDDLLRVLGDDVVKTRGTFDLGRYDHDFGVRGMEPAAVLLPRSSEDVSTALRICHAHGQPVVPQGGLTGLVGGGVPLGGSVALSLERFAGVEEIDTDAFTITVRAGSTLAAVQEAAEQAGFMFPLDYGSRGSAQIGGAAATNAGGNRVLRYGMARDMILGLEVVLADGRVLSSMNKMIKNNAGYDLKNLFIGSEGTLGVITRLVLKLSPKPITNGTVLCAAPDYESVLELLRRVRAGLGGDLSAFEVMWPEFYALATGAQSRPPPLAAGHPFYVLFDALGSNPESDATRFEGVVSAALEAGVITDAVLASSARDADDLWRIRESSASFPQLLGPNVSFDVSIPTGEIGRFARICNERLSARWPDVRSLVFGHVADSNIHLAVRLTGDALPKDEIDAIVYGTVRDWSGSVSAEHGIGTSKSPYLDYSRNPGEVQLMRLLKTTLDPNNILNPYKVLARERAENVAAA
jgi:FAD/FMN-containing dehydrogenase